MNKKDLIYLGNNRYINKDYFNSILEEYIKNNNIVNEDFINKKNKKFINKILNNKITFSIK
jgi:hypothetical protein